MIFRIIFMRLGIVYIWLLSICYVINMFEDVNYFIMIFEFIKIYIYVII